VIFSFFHFPIFFEIFLVKVYAPWAWVCMCLCRGAGMCELRMRVSLLLC
jgi:hypothetical protein